MKSSSRARYLRSLDRVFERLSNCIANERPLPAINVLARDAHLSEFHFMRIYRALAGESLGATIQRLRLARAAHLLTGSRVPITEIASRSGYETPQAFARAFRRQYGAAPGAVRKHPASCLDGSTAGTERRQAGTPPVVDVEIVELQPFRVAVLRNHGDYADLDGAYTRLFQWMAEQDAVESVTAIWGVPYHDRRDTPADECVFDCCVATSAKLAGDRDVRITRLGGGRYLVHRQTGTYAGLDDAHDRILESLLLAGDPLLREAPILHEFLNDPEHTPEANLETRIYVPIA